MGLTCVVPGCMAKGVTLHRFPNPKKEMDLFKRWLQILCIAQLYSVTPEKVYANKRVCFAHFDPSCKSPGHAILHRYSVPTIGLPVPQTSVPEEPASNPRCNTPIMECIAIVPERNSSGMLHSVAVRREVELTPKARILYKTAVHFKRQATRSTKKCLSFKERLEEAERCADSPLFAEKFFRMQIRETKNKPKGRKFTDQEKILCLTLFKNSPKSYDLLQRMFTLPCKKTLKMYLGRMSLKSGINQQLLDVLKKRVSKLNVRDRYCTVMFDEISLQAHVSYKLNQFDGFVDTGKRRTTDLADHALVFMARGICRTWKQPIAFSFCQGSTKGAELVQQLRTVLQSLFSIGLRPIATVCDQAAANVSAVNTLFRTTEDKYRRRSIEWRGGFFKVNNKKIFPLYDMPHLLKGIRNNLIRRDICFVDNGERLLAKWQHLVDLYTFDKERPGLRLLPQLSEAHVHPSHRQKMTVKYCSQVFSQRVSAILAYVAEQQSSSVPPEADETAKLFLFFDRLFDSVNSSSFDIPEGKPLRGPLRDGSAHVGFWDEAMKVLCSMEFVDPVSKRVASRPPSLTNWIATIRGLQLLWQNLHAVGFKFLLLRNLNQDPLENFFGSIRSHGSRNINPSCAAFIAAFKTLTVNNFTARKFIGANCEADMTEGALSTLGELLTQPRQLCQL